MARTSNDIQEHEVQAYEKFCIEHNILLDENDLGASIDNANFVREYFLNTWKETITQETLEKAFSQLRPHLKFKSKARLEYEKVASVNLQAAQQLVAWLDTQGKQEQLVNTLGDDQTYENLTLLLTTLRGYEISAPRIRDAENRIQAKSARKLHYVPTPRRPLGTITEAARKDDGTPFLGRDVNEPAWVKRSRERSEREAAEAASQQSGVSAQSAMVREARRKAEEMKGNTHSETEQLHRIFATVPGTSEIDWVQTAAARENLQRSLNKAQEVRRFIR